MKHKNYSSEMSAQDHKAEFEALAKNEQERVIMNPGHVDEAKWDKAKKISTESYGEHRWPFVMYMYEKLGGK